MTKKKKEWSLLKYETHILSEGDGLDYYKTKSFFNNETGEIKFYSKNVVDDIGVDKILKMLNK